MVTPDDVAVVLGRTPPVNGSAEFAQWSLWITDALMLVEARLGDLAALNQTRLDYVVREAVAAMVRRPDDALQVDVAVDDGRVSRRYQTSAGRVTIQDEWWQLLAPDAGTGAFSVTPAFVPDLVAVLPQLPNLVIDPSAFDDGVLPS